ncbi:unnamed protein product [Rhizopus stolonifer]
MKSISFNSNKYQENIEKNLSTITSLDDVSTVVSGRLTTDSSTTLSQERENKSQYPLIRSDTVTCSTFEKEEQVEDPYRWAILFGGFLAQAISMCTLSSWYYARLL